jgi:hypothetical protein
VLLVSDLNPVCANLIGESGPLALTSGTLLLNNTPAGLNIVSQSGVQVSASSQASRVDARAHSAALPRSTSSISASAWPASSSPLFRCIV